MPAAAAATVTATQMPGGGEDHQAVLKVKIPGQDFGRGFWGTVPGRHTRPAEAGLVAPVLGNLREQGFRNFDARTPAGSLVSCGGAELAVVGLAAQWTVGGSRAGWERMHHGTARISGRNRPKFWLGMRGSSEPGTGFSRSTWPSARVTLASWLCRKWALG